VPNDELPPDYADRYQDHFVTTLMGHPTDAANLRKSGIAVLTKLGGRRPVFSRAQLT
jgi:hypothetical protein